MSELGLGVLINQLGGNEETVNAVTSSLNKEITSLSLNSNDLVILFTDNSKLVLWDDGQSCCEERYMNCDDDLTSSKGEILLGFELKDAPNIEEENDYGSEHEVQFLEVKTNKSVYSFSNHNEHNGYYGGFSINAKLL